MPALNERGGTVFCHFMGSDAQCKTKEKAKHMKQNIIKSFGSVTNTGTNIIGGLTELETPLHIVHVPKVKVELDLQALLTANLAYQNGRVLLGERRESVRTLARQGRELAMVTRDMLKPRFGSQYSSVWEILGFQGSLEAPSSPEDVKIVLQAMQAYFLANPTLEVPALGITAALIGTALTNLDAAMIAVNIQDSALGVLRDTRLAALDGLEATIRAFIAELSLRIGPLDPRWKAFGLNVPGADETPDQVTGVTATLIGPTAVAVKWKLASRAEYYRVWFKVHGAPGDYAAAGSPADLDFTLENLPVNSTINIVLTAVNTGGESPVSDVITVTTQA